MVPLGLNDAPCTPLGVFFARYAVPFHVCANISLCINCQKHGTHDLTGCLNLLSEPQEGMVALTARQFE